MKKNRNSKIKCPSCGKEGFLTRRWVESQYYPQFVSFDVDEFEYLKEKVRKQPDNILLRESLRKLEKKVKGNKYRGENKKFLIKPEESESIKDKKDYYRVTYRRYYYYYICHYDKEKYNKNMERYKKGELKSRPNGRISHKLRESDYKETFDTNGKEVIEIGKGIRSKFRSMFL
jgi:hypothetical protein